MSLTGNLEDLPLLDIIQIVSFSKKTGYLTITTGDGDGAIVFRDGFVVASFTPDSAPVGAPERSLAPGKRSAAIRRRIEIALERLIRLREGQFSFSLTEKAPTAVGPRDVSAETLEVGINAQELLLDLARGIDEDRRDSSAALEASFANPAEESFADVMLEEVPARAKAPPPAPEPAPEEPPIRKLALPEPPPEAPPPPPASPAQEARTILLVDDEEEIRTVLADRLTSGGYQVVEAEDPDSALKKAGRLGKAGIEFLLVTDLGMPTSGGSSFQGGFEVVKRLWKMNLRPPVLMMTESLSGSLQARARQMGISSFVFKPGLSKLDPEQFKADLRAFASKIATDILPRLGRTPPARAKPPQAAPEAPRAASPAPALPSPDEMSRQFALLQRRLEELRRPTDATQIAALVMKVAREFFERGILFLVKNEEVRGLGGFGPSPKEESVNLLVRDVVIPLGEPSVFLDVVLKRKAFSGPLPDGKWSRYLLGKIGRFKTAEAVVLPLVAHRETIALLYGDNPETGRELGRLDGLEVFINQAGVALENAFLQRKIQTLQPRE